MCFKRYSKRTALLLLIFVFAGLFPNVNIDAAAAAGTPDLKIVAENLKISPTVIKGGTTATFRATVQNTGTGAASKVRVRFLLDGVEIGDKTISSIAKGGSGTASLSFKIPDSYNGTYTLTAVVDPENTVAETDETNNQAARSFVVLPNMPDLAVAPGNITVNPVVCKAGDNITIKATVNNAGYCAAANVTVRLFLGENQVGEKVISSINSQSGQSITFSYKLPGTLPPGQQLLKVQLDPDNTVSEISEENNIAEMPLAIGEAYADLAVSAADVRVSITNPKPGQKISVTAVIKNNGNMAVGKFTGQILAGSQKVAEKTNLSVKAYGTTTLTGSFTVPAGFSGGITVKVDPGNAVQEKDESNNTAVLPLSMAMPDIDLATQAPGMSWTVKPTGTIVAGTKFTVAGRVFNFGRDKSGPTAVTFNIVKYEPVQRVENGQPVWTQEELDLIKGGQSADRNSGDKERLTEKFGLDKDLLLFRNLLLHREKDVLRDKAASSSGSKRVLISLGSQNIPAVNAGGSVAVSRQLTLPANYNLTDCELEIEVNKNGGVFELNRANNVTVLHFPTRPRSKDVAIADRDISRSAPRTNVVKAGQNVTFRGVIYNNGTDEIKDLKVNILLNTRPDLNGAVLRKTRTISTVIKPGKNISFTETVQIPASATADQVLILHLDPENRLPEENETNNVGFHTVPITPQTRDLSVEVFQPNPVKPKVGDSVNWKVVVKNYGNTAASDINLGFYADVAADQPARVIKIDSIGPGSARTVTFTWTVPATLPFAVNYPVRVIADYDNRISETDEQNNGKTYLLSLQAPDLSMADSDVALGVFSLMKGHEFIVRATVHNNNILPVEGAKASLLYYVQGQNGNTLNKIGETDLGSVPKGQSKTVHFQAMLPDSIAVGTNVGFVVVADSANSVLETDESNNRAEMVCTVVQPPRIPVQPILIVDVTDEQGNDVQGAAVTIKNNATGLEETKTTGSEEFYGRVMPGRVLFENRPDMADYALTITKPGYRTIQQSINYDKNDDNTACLSYCLDKKATVSGKVVADGGAGLAGVTVTAVRANEFTLSAASAGPSTTTGADGHYELLLEPGNYILKYTKTGYRREIRTQPLSLGQLTNAFIATVTMSAETRGYLEGVITDDSGLPLPGVEIKNGSTLIGATDANGRFSLTVNAGSVQLKFSKSGYVSIQLPDYTVQAGEEKYVTFCMYRPSTPGHAEKGTGLISWHLHQGTPANAFFVPEYNVDVWYGLGRIKMGLDYSTSGNVTKAKKLDINITGLNWYAYQVQGEGAVETSAIDIPVTISAGGASRELTKMNVYRVAIESNGAEIWNSNAYWSSTDGPGTTDSSFTKSFNLGDLPITWNDDFKVKMWLRVEKKSLNFDEGEGAGPLEGVYMDRKLITWYPHKPTTVTITSTFEQVGSYLLAFLDNPVNAVAGLVDLFTVEEVTNYTMEEVMPENFPGN